MMLVPFREQDEPVQLPPIEYSTLDQSMNNILNNPNIPAIEKAKLYAQALAITVNNANVDTQIQISKNETFVEQCNQKRRPRICWNSLYPQISDNCQKIFDGKFDEIF